MVFSDTGIKKAQSIVTVPMTRNRCGIPTNLSSSRIKTDVVDLFDLILSWTPPNSGFCQITSYTIFWCVFNATINGCSVDVSESRFTVGWIRSFNGLTGPICSILLEFWSKESQEHSIVALLGFAFTFFYFRAPYFSTASIATCWIILFWSTKQATDMQCPPIQRIRVLEWCSSVVLVDQMTVRHRFISSDIIRLI